MSYNNNNTNFFTERSKREFSVRGLNKALFPLIHVFKELKGDVLDTITFNGDTVFWISPHPCSPHPMKAIWQGRKKHVHQSWRIFANYNVLLTPSFFEDEEWQELTDEE
jgi:hypothetical protein